ncbi:MAG: hypothetical protein M3R51_01050 [Candidatus Eremiobacteraeota bacterium]|nr:hypothetical protein [Candidatus Eremiobacteraeota bacterium]
MLALRIAFCYLVLFSVYIADDIARIIIFGVWNADSTPFPIPLLHVAIPWVGKHLGLVVTVFTNGSGDTTYDWILVLFNLILATAAGSGWFIFSRKCKKTPRLYAWLRLLARIVLAAILLLYGFDKVIPAQFGVLTPSRLSEPLGLLTPMGMLWTFMAASHGYTMLTGYTEVIGGLLLLFPRTAILGAIIGFVALANVLALDIFYDVPAKLLTFQLLVLDLFLLSHDSRALVNLLVLRRNAVPLAMPVIPTTPYARKAIMAATWLLTIAYCLTLVTISARSYSRDLASVDSKTPLYGVWLVDDFTLLPINTRTDTGRWERLAFDSATRLSLEIDGQTYRNTVAVDGVKHTLSISDAFNPSWKAAASYKEISAGVLKLRGEVNGVPFTAKIRRMDLAGFELTKWRLHLISEYPH